MAQDDHTRKAAAAAKPAAVPRADFAALWRRLIDRRETLDRQAFFRIGAWGIAGIATLALAFWAAQSPLAARRQAQGQTAEMIQRHAQQMQQAVRDAHNETRRLATALDVLNADRDRLFARVTALETDLASVTGSVAKVVTQNKAVTQNASAPAPAPPSPLLALAAIPSPLPVFALAEPPRSQPVTPPVTPPAATPSAEPAPAAVPPRQAAVAPAEKPDAKPDARPDTKPETQPAPFSEARKDAPEEPAARTLFGVDLGSASSVDGLRALWGGVQKAHGAALDGLRPIIVLKERSGGQGLQLRLVAGPVPDAVAAAKLCAGFLAAERSCETAIYEGQRLVLPSDKPARPRARRTEARSQPATTGPFFSLR